MSLFASYLVNVPCDAPNTAGVVVIWSPVMKAARSKVASEAARTGGQEEDELVTEEDETHHHPLGHEVEDVLETGQHLVIVSVIKIAFI